MVNATGGYNSLAGQDVDRIKALTDGIFAFAVTVLVLGLSGPAAGAIFAEGDLLLWFVSIAPRLLVYFMSFITLGIFWMAHTAQYTYIVKSDRHLTWLSLFYLMFVSLVPFSTALLSGYITFRMAVIVYWLNILLLGLFLLIHWQYARKNDFFSPVQNREEIYATIRNRIITAQSLYAAAALLCVISTYISIGLIIAIQLNYALAPAFRHRFS